MVVRELGSDFGAYSLGGVKDVRTRALLEPRVVGLTVSTW